MYKIETRDEKLCVLTGLKMPDLIASAKKNLLEAGLATEENISQELEDSIEFLCKSFIEEISQLSDEVLIILIKESLDTPDL